MNIIVCNAGSTSLKFKLIEFPGERVLSKGSVERIGQGMGAYSFSSADGRTESGEACFSGYEQGISRYLEFIGGADRADAAAFKAVLAWDYPGVHVIDDKVVNAMRDALTVAPAHNRAYLAAIQAFRKAAPKLPLAASFETGFHTTIPPERYIYPVPYEWYEHNRVRRIGYHGASHEGMALEMKDYRRVISCHLGGSGSICAIEDGKSVDTSFGMSLQAGIPHVNRCGDIDPYIINHMLSGGMSYDEVIKGMEKKGGLAGISGLSGDMRDLRREAKEGNERAKLALDVYVTGVVRYIGAFAAELGGLDALGFTGGIGENDSETRLEICKNLKFLGIELDEGRNSANERRIEKVGSKPVFVIRANEELTVARKVYALLTGKDKTV